VGQRVGRNRTVEPVVVGKPGEPAVVVGGSAGKKVARQRQANRGGEPEEPGERGAKNQALANQAAQLYVAAATGTGVVESRTQVQCDSNPGMQPSEG